jgi:hypothetical protein
VGQPGQGLGPSDDPVQALFDLETEPLCLWQRLAVHSTPQKQHTMVSRQSQSTEQTTASLASPTLSTQNQLSPSSPPPPSPAVSSKLPSSCEAEELEAGGAAEGVDALCPPPNKLFTAICATALPAPNAMPSFTTFMSPPCGAGSPGIVCCCCWTATGGSHCVRPSAV